MALLPINNKDGICAYTKIDDDLLEGLSVMKWRFDAYGYVVAHTPMVGGKRQTVKLHRLITSAPAGLKVDHIDRNKLNNLRSNLRIVSHAQNCQNRAAKGASKYRGVTKSGERWRARGKLNGKETVIGYFETEEDAGIAASNWRKENMPYSTEDGDYNRME